MKWRGVGTILRIMWVRIRRTLCSWCGGKWESGWGFQERREVWVGRIRRIWKWSSAWRKKWRRSRKRRKDSFHKSKTWTSSCWTWKRPCSKKNNKKSNSPDKSMNSIKKSMNYKIPSNSIPSTNKTPAKPTLCLLKTQSIKTNFHPCNSSSNLNKIL